MKRSRPVTRSMTHTAQCAVVPSTDTIITKNTAEEDDHAFSQLPPEIQSQITALQQKIFKPLVQKLLTTYNSRVMPESTEINDDLLNQFQQHFDSDEKNKLVQQTLVDLPIEYTSEQRDYISKLNYYYSNTLDRHPMPSNQQHSGRCWLFAALNAARIELMRKYNLPDTFELSEGFLFFYDKLERCNYFMENMIKLRGEKTTSLEFYGLTTYACPIEDGGTWGFFMNLIKKYGIVPKDNYQECYNTMDTTTMNELLKNIVTQFTAEIHREENSKATDEQLRLLKDQMFLPEIYSLLVKMMGKPPETFDWEYYEDYYGSNNSRVYRRVPNLTPKAFYDEYIDPEFRADDKIWVVHDPRESSSLYHTLSIPGHGNMVGGMPDEMVNISLDEMKQAMINSIKLHRPVWIACDVGKYFSHERDLLSTEAFDFSAAANTNLEMSKADQLKFGFSTPSHAMLCVGVDLDDDGNPRKWRIENSWGVDYGNDPGYLLMTDEWFDKYMYYAIVDRSCLTEGTRTSIEAHSGKVINLDFNDPFGAVARN